MDNSIKVEILSIEIKLNKNNLTDVKELTERITKVIDKLHDTTLRKQIYAHFNDRTCLFWENAVKEANNIE